MEKIQTDFTVKYLFIFIVSKVRLGTIVESDPKAPFSSATTPRCSEGGYSFLLCVKQGSIK